MAPLAPESITRYWMSLGVSISMQGMGMAPIFRQATIAICHSGRRGIKIRMRSPLRSP